MIKAVLMMIYSLEITLIHLLKLLNLKGWVRISNLRRKRLTASFRHHQVTSTIATPETQQILNLIGTISVKVESVLQTASN